MKQTNRISVAELWEMSHNMYDDLVKAVVDVEQKILVQSFTFG
jgi:hypothetical protein